MRFRALFNLVSIVLDLSGSSSAVGRAWARNRCDCEQLAAQRITDLAPFGA